jgi:hypothetical protein
MNGALRVLLLALAFLLATYVAGWWAVPLVGAAWGAIAARGSGSRFTAGRAALAAAIAWGAAIAGNAPPTGGVHTLGATAAVVGGALRANGVAFVVVTLLYAAVLAWSSSALVSGILRRVR